MNYWENLLKTYVSTWLVSFDDGLAIESIGTYLFDDDDDDDYYYYIIIIIIIIIIILNMPLNWIGFGKNT